MEQKYCQAAQKTKQKQNKKSNKKSTNKTEGSVLADYQTWPGKSI